MSDELASVWFRKMTMFTPSRPQLATTNMTPATS